MQIKDSVITFDIHERCLGIVRAVVDGRGDVGEDGDEEEEVDEADAVAVEHHLQRTGQVTGGFETIYLRVGRPELPDGFLLHIPDDGVRHEGEADHQHAGQVEARGQLEQSAVQCSSVMLSRTLLSARVNSTRPRHMKPEATKSSSPCRLPCNTGQSSTAKYYFKPV